MATRKTVTIQGYYGGVSLSLDFLHVTDFSENRNLDSDIKKTFSGAVPIPSSDGGYTIKISTLEARDLEDFIKLKRILKGMEEAEGSISIFEDVKNKTGDFTQEHHYTGVLISSNEVTFSSEDLTARDLEFTAKDHREVAGGIEVYK